MGKRKGDQPNSETPDRADNEPDKLAAQPIQSGLPAEPISKIDAPELAPSQPPQIAAAATAPVVPPAPAAVVVAPKVEAAIAAPPIAPSDEVRPDNIRPGEAIAPPASVSSPSFREPSRSWTKARRLMPLAATIAIAAAIGAMAGSIATTGLTQLWAGQPVAKTANATPVKDAIARVNADIAALKGAIETSAKSANSQFTKLGDRFDRIERAQAEPAAKLAKLAEAVERIERRAPASAATAAHDVTGSVATPAPAPQVAAAEPVRPAGPPVLEGWYVRSVYNGAALIQGRLGGVMEVEPGDNLPGLGRIETIRREDGRWVVVTTRGRIVSR
jgi:hypothetical protein